jgi:hypothetical protein
MRDDSITPGKVIFTGKLLPHEPGNPLDFHATLG